MLMRYFVFAAIVFSRQPGHLVQLRICLLCSVVRLLILFSAAVNVFGYAHAHRVHYCDSSLFTRAAGIVSGCVAAGYV